jgi:hypothetical protein
MAKIVMVCMVVVLVLAVVAMVGAADWAKGLMGGHSNTGVSQANQSQIQHISAVQAKCTSNGMNTVIVDGEPRCTSK